MKKSVFALFAVISLALAGQGNAGYYDVPASSSPASNYGAYGYGKSSLDSAVDLSASGRPKTSCFDLDAINFDIFGGYAFADVDTGPYSDDGAVVGIGAETFYTDMFGGRFQALYWDSANDVGDISASLIARFPMHDMQMAPYIYGGGGGMLDGMGNVDGAGHIGVGLDYRFGGMNCMGLVFDFRRTWIADNDGYYLLTMGLRISL